MIIRSATPEDFDAILALQTANTPNALGEAAYTQGYIVSTMDRNQLAAINAQLGILVAVVQDQVVAFVCLTTTDARPRPPIIDKLLKVAATQRFRGRSLRAQRVFLWGPICIARSFRGKGVLRPLFEAACQRTHSDYDAGVAFIADDNPHSLAAHVTGLSMHDLTTFAFGKKTYHLIVFAV